MKKSQCGTNDWPAVPLKVRGNRGINAPRRVDVRERRQTWIESERVARGGKGIEWERGSEDDKKVTRDGESILHRARKSASIKE